MNLLEAMEAEVTREEAKAEIDRHDSDGGWDVFIAEHGDHPEYEGATVLGWLGY
jgi:hypothetical protein